MALVKSVFVPTGNQLPSFSLKDPFGKNFDSQNILIPTGLLVVFTCNHCPYAIALWPRLIHFIEEAKDKGLISIAINPNIHPDYPEDSPQKMKEKVQEESLSFPYLIDRSQSVAKQFQAQCTPDIYLFDANAKLFYHGRFDNNWKNEKKVSQHDLKEAFNTLSQGKLLKTPMIPSMGCSIKWQ